MNPNEMRIDAAFKDLKMPGAARSWRPLIAYSDPIRPPFRGQTGHCSDVNPATLPRGIRPLFRADSGHFSWMGRN